MKTSFIRVALWLQLLLVVSPVKAAPCDRIVALAPSVVEVVHSLGLSSNVVGVDRFTRYPESVQALAHAGGLLDPNLEGILSRKPTIIFGLTEHRDLINKLKALGVSGMTFEHRRLKGILDSITEVGKACAVEERASSLRLSLAQTTEAYRARTLGKKKERALVLVGGRQDALTLTNIYVSGRDGFYADLLELAGAENVFHGLTGAFSGVSREALIKEDPDYIFHVVSDHALSAFDRGAIQDVWKTLPYLKAVKKNRVFILSDYVDSIPGPRFPLVLEKLFQFLHPGEPLP